MRQYTKPTLKLVMMNKCDVITDSNEFMANFDSGWMSGWFDKGGPEL